ncbi:hypothetical protein [Deinococcus sp. UR1]|uniref:hypothetical protein n=1 Tax=Deinococcus sp. UR1 TaxID=1704277 RepID=UPI000C19C8BE|nr:hypothetical protein [Deinococcus sp. UR1]PIG96898.1 hypothetical protein AMD26_015330 [Deinococcus sp. UR1]
MQVTTRRRTAPAHPTADKITLLVSAKLRALTTAELTDAAGQLNLHRNTLYNIMRGSVRPTLDSACAILAHVGAPLDVPDA